MLNGRSITITTELVAKIDHILARGLSKGVGERGVQVCVEAAICEALGLPHGDDPKCVAASVRSFKIQLNELGWSSPEARAKGLRSVAIAQLGSLGVVNDEQFCLRLSEKVIRKLIPVLFREVFPDNSACLAAADRCENEGTAAAAYAAARAADAAAADAAAARAAYAAARAAARAAYAAARAAYAADAAARAAADAAYAADAVDRYFILTADLAFEVLKELNSPGCAWA